MGLRTGILLFILPCICPFFFLSAFLSKISLQLYKIEKFIFDIQNNNDKLYRGIDNQLCPVCPSLYLISFLSLHAVNTLLEIEG